MYLSGYLHGDLNPNPCNVVVSIFFSSITYHPIYNPYNVVVSILFSTIRIYTHCRDPSIEEDVRVGRLELLSDFVWNVLGRAVQSSSLR